MRKTLSVLLLIFVLCTPLFADNRVTVSFDPFSFQSFVGKEDGKKSSVNSTYGIGGGIGYNRNVWKNFVAGADIKADTYMMEGQKNFTDISFLAKFGYIANVSETVGFYGNMKAGLDLQAHNNKTSAVLEFGPEIGAMFKLNEKYDLFASCEGLFGFPKNDKNKYSEFRVTPSVGVGYTF